LNLEEDKKKNAQDGYMYLNTKRK